MWQLPYRADLYQYGIPLGEGKEALDIELYTIKEGLLVAKGGVQRLETGAIRVFSDS